MIQRAITLLLAAAPAFGQAAAPPTFEVATLKASDPTTAMAIRRSGHHFYTVNTSLEFLIGWAYDLHAERIYGKPKWLDSAHYDITANATEESWQRNIPGQYTPLQLMMQALLGDRFQLAVHRETRRLPMYALVVAKGGAKFATRDHAGPMGQNPFAKPGLGVLVGTEVDSGMLAKVLSQETGRSVQDETGLKGVFDFKLRWQPEAPPPGSQDAPGATANLRGGASLFTALEEQLGLKLEARRGPVEVLVIDHVEPKPTDN